MSSPARPARLPEGPSSPGPSLAIVRGPKRGTILPLVFAETLIGRIDANHLVLDDESVSRVHARLLLVPGGVVAEDLQSRTGTFVNGRRLTAPTVLADGDELVLGAVAFVFAASGHERA